MNNTAIFWPMIFNALFTLALYIPMSRQRVAAVRAGDAKPADFKLTASEPAKSAPFVNAIANQYEAPVLFYAVCIAAYSAQVADMVMVVLAFAFGILKFVHIMVLVRSNNLRIRRPMFMAVMAVLILMWFWFAFRLMVG